MTRTMRQLLVATTVTLGLTACSQEGMNGPDDNGPFNTFGSAFTSAPVGMENTATSYAGGGDGMPWEGPGRGMGFMRGMGGIMGGRDMMGGPGMDGLMGGGLESNYGGEGPTTDGGPGNSRGRGGPHGGPFGGNGLRIDDSCKFATPTLTCGPTTRNGLTTTTVYTIKTAANVACG